MKGMDNTVVYWQKLLKACIPSQIVIGLFDTCFIPDAHHHCRGVKLPFQVLLLLLDYSPSYPWYLIVRP